MSTVNVRESLTSSLKGSWSSLENSLRTLSQSEEVTMLKNTCQNTCQSLSRVSSQVKTLTSSYLQDLSMSALPNLSGLPSLNAKFHSSYHNLKINGISWTPAYGGNKNKWNNDFTELYWYSFEEIALDKNTQRSELDFFLSDNPQNVEIVNKIIEEEKALALKEKATLSSEQEEEIDKAWNLLEANNEVLAEANVETTVLSQSKTETNTGLSQSSIDLTESNEDYLNYFVIKFYRVNPWLPQSFSQLKFLHNNKDVEKNKLYCIYAILKK
jgi:hypothetical protein